MSRTICVMGRVLDQQDGLGVYSENLLKCMAKMDLTSTYVVLLRTEKRASMFDDCPNVRTRVIPARWKLWWDQVRVPLAARRCGADIIFNPKFSVPLLSMRPSVFVLQGSDWYVYPENYEWWDNLYIRLMIPIYCWKAARMLSISECTLRDLAKYAHVETEKVTVSYAAPGSQFHPIEDAGALRRFAERHRLPERFMFSVARAYHTGYEKLPKYPGGNIDGLIRGYRSYREAGGKLPLVIAGRDIEPFVRSLGFDDGDLQGLHFTGFIPNEEIVFAYNLADFFVLTTLYESFAFPLVEAMACGCPAIAPSTGACPEVSAGAALLVHPQDAIEIGRAMADLERSPEMRGRLREDGLRRVRDFSWKRSAQLTLDVFDQICSETNHPLQGLEKGSIETPGYHLN